MKYLSDFEQYISHSVSNALQEDLGGSPGIDLTAQLIPESQMAVGELISREKAIICGCQWVEETFNQLDTSLSLEWLVSEGEVVEANQKILIIKGAARSILTGERTAMNFLQTLSGTATTTRNYVEQLKGTQCKLLDTRKTIPGLRAAQKYAVTIGGGENHRVGLFDAYLIKENHIATAGGISKAVQLARKLNSNVKLEVEVENLDELKEAISAKADVIMLDNFTKQMMKEAVAIKQETKTQTKFESSGDITLENIKDYASTGIDYISVGALTKHLRAIDLSLRVKTV
ncbi:carboxylating nicotinate-nucleotide diphosphorylase [Pleionea sediminis]|uniref:carboxylating nicotinate-nucleotide diphosphorylase n=1 Tax=Pleionea sediminis TaxID=2569479 RepID=UPI001186CF3A|nr:carboxylating nicotinate-nucleotide diphosphorylase [Pleionea sediminis]